MASVASGSAPGGAAPGATSKGLREAALAGGVALALMVPLIGLHAASATGGLALRTRFTDIFIAAGLVFLGRFALVLVREGRPWPALTRSFKAKSWPQ